MQLFRKTRKRKLDELFDAFYSEADYTSDNLEFLVELAQQLEDFPVVSGQRDAFTRGEGIGDGRGPVVQVDQKAVLVQGNRLIANVQRTHSQLLTLS